MSPRRFTRLNSNCYENKWFLVISRIELSIRITIQQETKGENHNLFRCGISEVMLQGRNRSDPRKLFLGLFSKSDQPYRRVCIVRSRILFTRDVVLKCTVSKRVCWFNLPILDKPPNQTSPNQICEAFIAKPKLLSLEIRKYATVSPIPSDGLGWFGLAWFGSLKQFETLNQCRRSREK